MSIFGPALAARRGPARIAAAIDSATFTVLVGGVALVPILFSIALSDVFALPKTVMTVSLAGVIALMLAARFALTRDVPSWTPLGVSLAAFVACASLATVVASDPGHALVGESLQYQGLATWVAYAVFMLGAWATVRGPGRRRVLVLALVAGSVVVASYALVQRAGLDPLWRTMRLDRPFSTIGQANALGAYLAATLPVVSGLALSRSLAGRVLFGGLTIAMAATLGFTMSRGGYLAATAAVVVLAITAVADHHRRGEHVLTVHQALIGAAVGAMAVVVILGVPAARNTAMGIVQRAVSTGDLTEGSIRSHLNLWSVGYRMVVDHPVLGSGPDSYVLEFPAYRDEVLAEEDAANLRRFRPESPHNVYLAIAGGAGLPALAAYLTVVSACLAGLVRRLRSGPEAGRLFAGLLLASLAAHLVSDSFMTAETSGSLIFWVLLGSAAALASEVRRPGDGTTARAGLGDNRVDGPDHGPALEAADDPTRLGPFPDRA